MSSPATRVSRRTRRNTGGERPWLEGHGSEHDCLEIEALTLCAQKFGRTYPARPNENDRTGRSHAREPVSTSPCLTVFSLHGSATIHERSRGANCERRPLADCVPASASVLPRWH